MTQAAQQVTLRVDEGVAEMTIQRPPLNILDKALLGQLSEILGDAGVRTDWRVLVLRGIPKAFSAGVAVEDHFPDRIEGTLATFHDILLRVERMDRPTVAAIRGHCLGGGMELAMACDLAVASEDATFGQPEIRLAAIPPYAVARYADLVGPRRAFADLATGRTFPAKEAMEAGYLTACVPDDELDAWVGRAANEMAGLSADALAVLKRSFRRQTRDDAFAEAERTYVRELASTPDAVEGLRAFLEKRAPRWGGRT